MMDTLGQRICLDSGNQIAKLAHVPGYISEDVLMGVLSVGDQ